MKWKILAILSLGSAIVSTIILAVTTVIYLFVPYTELLYYPTAAILVCIALFILAIERMPPDPFKE